MTSQTIQLGTGTDNTTITTCSPANIWYRRAVMQFVYTAAELSAAGASSTSSLSEIGFYITSNPIYDLPGYTIKLKHTTSTDVSSALGTTGWTTIVNGFNYAPSPGGFDMLPLDSPFTWDGVSNIGVEICFSRVNPNYNSSGTVRYYNTTNGFRYSRTDAGGSSCGSTPATVSIYKPQCQMIFATESEWLGTTSSDWFDASNWSAGVPNDIMDAVISGGAPNNPVITGTGAVCQNIDISSGASLTIADVFELNVNGSWNCDGTFNENQSTVNFQGNNISNLSGTSNQSFYNIVNLNTAGLNFQNGSYFVYGNLAPEGGDITTNGLLTIGSDTRTGRIGQIKSLCSYTLNMNDSYGDSWNGAELEIIQDGISLGTYSAIGSGSSIGLNFPLGSSIELIYTSGLYENENTYSLLDDGGTTIFSDGTNPSTGSVFTFTSNCAATTTDPFVGNITMERSLNLSSNGWRELGSPIAGLSLNDWQNDAITMSGFTGSDFPSFGWISAYTYNENNANGTKENGWVPANNITDAIGHSNGHRIYIGSGNYKISISGDVNVGEHIFNLDYENILAAEQAASENQKGWNLIANPLPSPISWDNIPASRKVNLEDAFWVWSADAGNYGLYVGAAGSGTNGVGENIATHQAFWVHADNASSVLTINENDKIDTDQAFVKTAITSNYFGIGINSNLNSFSDEILISIATENSNNIDENDGLKLFSPVSTAPSLYMRHDENNLSINSINDTNELQVPIYAEVGISGTYNLSFTKGQIENLGCLTIDDLISGSSLTVDSSLNYAFFQNQGDTNARFLLHFYPKTRTTPIHPVCHDNNEGSIAFNLSGQNNSISLLDSSFQVINTQPNLTSSAFEGVPPGNYFVLSNSNNGTCLSDTNSVEILSASKLEISNLDIEEVLCDTCQSGSINFNISGGEAPYQILLNGNSMKLPINNLSAGVYDIIIQDSKGCNISNSFEIRSMLSTAIAGPETKDFAFFPNPSYGSIRVVSSKSNCLIDIFDQNGKIILQSTTNDFISDVDISSLAAGSYIISFNNQQREKLIVLERP